MCEFFVNKEKASKPTMKVSLNDAKMRATPNTCSPSRTVGPSVTFSTLASLVFFLDCKPDTTECESPMKNKLKFHSIADLNLRESIKIPKSS